MRNHLWSGGFFKWEEDNKPDSNYIYVVILVYTSGCQFCIRSGLGYFRVCSVLMFGI